MEQLHYVKRVLTERTETKIAYFFIRGSFVVPKKVQ